MSDASLLCLCFVQNWQGGAAGGLVGSELAAMMDHAVLPEILGIYIANGTFESERRDVAARMGMPVHQVDFCFFVAVDNDKRHAHFRRVLLAPRYTQVQCQRKLARQRDLILQEEWARGSHSVSAQVMWQRLQERCAVYGATLHEYVRMKWAEADPQARTLHPEQYQPLPPQTPELNMPIEHCVHTFKGGIADKLHQPGVVDSKELRNAKAYHEIADSVGQERFGKGIRQHDVDCSVRKMLCTAKILAAAKGEWVKVRHRFRDSKEEQDYWVQGTGGEWISDPRWT